MKSSYELMHKNIPVASCEIEDGRVVKVGNVSCKDHAPVGTYDKFGMSKKLLDQWFRRRAIPASRDNIKEILERPKDSISGRNVGKSLRFKLIGSILDPSPGQQAEMGTN